MILRVHKVRDDRLDLDKNCSKLCFLEETTHVFGWVDFFERFDILLAHSIA